MGKYLRDTDQSEKELLEDLFNMLEYEKNGRLTINKLTLLAREKFNIHINDEQAKEMIQALGVKRGK
jgi:Ca2+-binding EF-hand superfamily protein